MIGRGNPPRLPIRLDSQRVARDTVAGDPCSVSHLDEDSHMFTTLMAAALMVPTAPVPRDTAPTGPAPYILARTAK